MDSPLLRSDSDWGDPLLRGVALLPPVPSLHLPEPGERLGGRDGARYEVLALVGGGGMGQVFRALDHELRRTVALKFLLPGACDTAPSWSSVLREEAQAVARLDHENIVRIHDVSEWNPPADSEDDAPSAHVPFLVMEFLEGESLQALLLRGRPCLERALHILGDVAAGLAHAHERRLVHLDLKPANVFILSGGRAKLLDFGLARPPDEVSFGSTEPPAGTPAYMAPEQWRGAPTDARTDIWAAGLLLRELLTGEPLYADLPLARFRARLLSADPVPPVRNQSPEVPEAVARLVDAALSKDPAKRPASGAELLARLLELKERFAPRRASAAREGTAGRRQVTLLSCHLVLATDSSAVLDSEDAGELEAAFHQACARRLHGHEGAMTTAVGAEVLACFGHPLAREDDSERAVRAALDLTRALPRELSGLGLPGLDVKVGIHTGLVTLADALPELHGTTPAMQGDAPKVAGWLATQAAPGTVLLSDRTYTLVRGRVETRALETRAYEGLAGTSSVGLHQALRERPSVSRFDRALVVGALTPLVGRDPELARLEQLQHEALGGRGAFVLLRGEAGIGKSRLVQELHDRQPAGASTWARCQCWPQYEHSALHPLIDWLQRFLALTGEASPQRRRARLDARLESLGLTSEHGDPLASLLSLPLGEGSTFIRLPPERQRDRSLESLVAFLQAEATRRPLVLVVEDLHWADPSTLQFLGVLLGRISGVPLQILLTTRPGFTYEWKEHPCFHELKVEPLSAEASTALVREATRGRALPAEVVERLVRGTDGIPLFVEEVSRMVLEQAVPDRAVPGGLSFPIPATLYELLLARLDQLPPRSRAQVQLAATLGREFSYELLRSVSALQEPELLPELARLEQAGLLFGQGPTPCATYAFKHALIQDAAYQSLLRGTRQRYHARIVHVLSEQFPAEVEEKPELLAQHATLAALPDQAVDAWRRAGQQACSKSAFAESISHYTRALEQLSRLPASHRRGERELALQLELGQVLTQTKGFSAKEVESAYTRACALCEPSGNVPVPVLWGLSNIAVVRGDREGMARLAGHLQGLLETRQDPEALIVAHAKLAIQDFWQGHYAASQRHCEQATAVAGAHGCQELLNRLRRGDVSHAASDSLLYAFLYRSYSKMMRGLANQAREDFEEVLALAEATHHPYTVATTLMFGAALLYEAGAPEAARDLSTWLLTLSSENGLPFPLAIGQCFQGWALSRLGEVTSGISMMKEGLGLLKLMGAMVVYPRKQGYLITVLLRSGRIDEGLATVEEAKALAETSLGCNALPELWRLQGELLFQRGDVGAAEDCLHRALAAAHDMGGLLHELRAAVSLARLPLRASGARQARALLTEVCGRFTEGFGVADYQSAREQLVEAA